MRVVDKRQALGALVGIPRASNESGSAQQVTSGSKVRTRKRITSLALDRQIRRLVQYTAGFGNPAGAVREVILLQALSTTERGRQIARPRAPRSDRMLSWQLDAALFLEENAGGWFERWLARFLRRRLEARLPGWVR